MMTFRIVKLISIWIVLTGTVCEAKGLIVDKVSIDETLVQSKNKALVEGSFEISEEGDVNVNIYNEDSVLVWSATQYARQGKNKFKWDCTDQNGDIIPNGAYIYTLEAKVEDGRQYVYNPAGYDWGRDVDIIDGEYDAKEGVIRFTLPRKARYRIRIGLLDGGPQLLTLKDWEPGLAETYEIPWDGFDEMKSFDLRDHPKRKIYISAYALPANSVIVRLGEMPKRYDIKRDMRFVGQVMAAMTDGPKERNQHMYRDSFQRHDPKMSIEVLSNDPVGKVLKTRISIDPDDQLYLINTRYEIMFFIDGVYLQEEEEGLSPYNFTLNTKHLPLGEHVLTVNIMNPEDYVGTKSIKFKVEE